MQGRVLDEALRPDARSPSLIVTVVIDGGGWNALNIYPDAWPNLRRLISSGVSIEGATVGSSPSITPATHTTLATGVFPKDHGVTALQIRADNGEIVPAFAREFDHLGPDVTPSRNLRQPTLAELWDVSVQNRAEIGMVASFNYALGMIGRGAQYPGGDRDLLAIGENGRWETHPELYRMPAHLEAPSAGIAREVAALDASDGRKDGHWGSYDFERLDATPAFTRWEQRAIEQILTRGKFGRDDITDLLYINYKPPDQAAHRWTVESRQERAAIRSVDAAIGSLRRHLDATVGSTRYLLVVTADHGQTEVTPDRFTLNQEKVVKDVQEALGKEGAPSLIEKTSPTTYFLDDAALEANHIGPHEVADFLAGYTVADYASKGQQLPKGVQVDRDAHLFEAVFPGSAIRDVLDCTD